MGHHRVTNAPHYFLEFKWLVIQSSLEDLELISQIIWMVYAGVLAFIDRLSYKKFILINR